MTSSGTKTSGQTTNVALLEEQAIHGKPICLILARKHSKRLPHKHTLLLNGKPLILYAIEAAKKSEVFESVVVSSDDTGILETAYEAKCIIHKRTPNLTGDKVQMKEVVRWMMGIYDFGKCACLLNACNPLVTPEDIRESNKLFWDKNANYVMAVTKVQYPVEYLIRLEDGRIECQAGLKQCQKHQQVYQPAGSIIWFNSEIFINEMEYDFRGTNCYPYVINHPSVDIDTQADFDLAAYYLLGK